MLPLLAVLSFATMAVVSYALLASAEFEEACANHEQAVRITAATRVRLIRSARRSFAASGALIAAPRDRQDVRAMVEFCDTATAADVPALRDVALDAECPLAAGNAVRALGRLRAFVSDPDLLRLLDDPRERVRDEAILALGESRETSALVLLEARVQADDEHVRVLAIRALGRAGGERARRTLADIAADPVSTPQAAAFARAGLARPAR